MSQPMHDPDLNRLPLTYRRCGRRSKLHHCIARAFQPDASRVVPGVAGVILNRAGAIASIPMELTRSRSPSVPCLVPGLAEFHTA